MWDNLTRLHQDLKERIAAAAEHGGVEHGTGEYQLDRTPSPDVKTAVRRRPPDGHQRGPAARARGLHRAPQARQGSSSAGARRSVPTAASTGPTPRRSPSRRCSPRARRSASPARTRSAGPSASATSSCTTRAPVRRCARSRTCPARSRRSSCTTARCRRSAALGLRVRLQPGGARDARAVGGPVRRLRQPRPGDHRPVHRLRPGQVGPDLAPDAAAPARLRGLGARALLRAPGAVPPARRRGKHPRGQPRPRRPSTSTCCAARPGSPSSARSSS